MSQEVVLKFIVFLCLFSFVLFFLEFKIYGKTLDFYSKVDNFIAGFIFYLES